MKFSCTFQSTNCQRNDSAVPISLCRLQGDSALNDKPKSNDLSQLRSIARFATSLHGTSALVKSGVVCCSFTTGHNVLVVTAPSSRSFFHSAIKGKHAKTIKAQKEEGERNCYCLALLNVYKSTE